MKRDPFLCPIRSAIAALSLLLTIALAGTGGAQDNGQGAAPDPDPAPKPADAPDPAPAPEAEPAAPEAEPPAEDKPGHDADGEPEEETKPATPVEEDDGYDEIRVLTRAIETIRRSYVDEKKISYKDLVDAALDGMLRSLDPHCQYMHRRVYDQMKEDQGGTYDGVGITIAPKDDTLTVIAVREDGPAARAGLLSGDQILKIGDILTDKVGLAEAGQLLRGKPGEPLNLTIRRPATKEVLEVEMVREVIKESSIKDAMMLPERYAGGQKIGYARLLQFNAPSAGELADALDRLEDEGMEAFVLDLRNNPGGLLNTAIDICGEFVPGGTTIVTTEGRVDSQNPPPYRTNERKRRERTYPLAILVDHSSASASEVVSGALQDLKRAIIVGETTFGKGSVQTILPMEDGSAMRLTTAKYYTPSKKTIHEKGIRPNIVATLTPDEAKDLARWRNRENMEPKERAKLERDFRDRQLERAADALKAVLVYQGLE
ncbi:MAG: S41 family peptidase [Verrucomicrobiales bacterium]